MTRVKTYFHTLLFTMQCIQGEEQFDLKNYLLEIPFFQCQNAFEKCTTKTELFNGSSSIKKLYTRL